MTCQDLKRKGKGEAARLATLASLADEMPWRSWRLGGSIVLIFSLIAPAAGAGPDMVRIPGGTFVMGRDDGPADERPAHRVTLRPFEIDRLPVTNAQFARFLNAVGPHNARGENLFDDDDSDARIHKGPDGWKADPGFEDHPVVEVRWAGARDYCAWVGKRLPTEAEWELAARGAEGRAYPWGNQPPDATRARYGAAFNAHVPVGRYSAGATPEGLLDMAGNVWQWVSSAYRPYPYRADDGREDLPDVRVERGARGGCHDCRPEDLRATERGRRVSRRPDAGHHNIGFRCAREPPRRQEIEPPRRQGRQEDSIGGAGRGARRRAFGSLLRRSRSGRSSTADDPPGLKKKSRGEAAALATLARAADEKSWRAWRLGGSRM